MGDKSVPLTATGGWPGIGWPKDELVRYLPAEPLEARIEALEAENARLRDALNKSSERMDAEWSYRAGDVVRNLHRAALNAEDDAT